MEEFVRQEPVRPEGSVSRTQFGNVLGKQESARAADRRDDTEPADHLEPAVEPDVQPDAVDPREAAIDDSVEMTFPASDPPAWTAGHVG